MIETEMKYVIDGEVATTVARAPPDVGIAKHSLILIHLTGNQTQYEHIRG
jgi:hypothetical protein